MHDTVDGLKITDVPYDGIYCPFRKRNYRTVVINKKKYEE